MAYNTGNPIGSTSPRDLYDNAENLDQAVNSASSNWTDRLGRNRKTFRAAENAADAAEAAASTAITRAENAADDAVNTQIPGQVQRATDYVETTIQPTSGDGLSESVAKSALRAESARDAAFVNADVFEDVDSGMASTPVGEQFIVVEGDFLVRRERSGPNTKIEVARVRLLSQVDIASRNLDTVTSEFTYAVSKNGVPTDGSLGYPVGISAGFPATLIVARFGTGFRYVAQTLISGGGSEVSCRYFNSTTGEVLQDWVTNTTPSVEFLGEHGLFYIGGRYIRDSGEVWEANDTPGLRCTGFLPLDGVERLKAKGYGIGVIAICAFYDSERNFLEAVTEEIGDAEAHREIDVPRSEWPEGTRFVRVTGIGSPDDYVNLMSYGEVVSAVSDAGYEIQRLVERGVKERLSGIFLTGASFVDAGPRNTWPSMAESDLGVRIDNKGRSGTGRPSTDAHAIREGLFLSDSDFLNTDVFAFQYANVENIDDKTNLLSTPEDYTSAFDVGGSGNQFAEIYTEAQSMDWILKHLQQKCFDEKDNLESRWYGYPHGKPLRLVFITHWHDARDYYNGPIRELAERWGAKVCEFDRSMPFSKSQPFPDGTQPSVYYAQDTETIGGVTYGWHPKRYDGGEYIQRKMADEFSKCILEQFGGVC